MYRPIVLGTTLLLALAACGETSAPTAVATPLAARAAGAAAGNVLARSANVVPFSRPFYNSCVGESVWGAGEVHMSRLVVQDGTGVEREVFHANPHGVTGVGQSSGDRYHMVGAESHVSSDQPDGDGRSSVVQIMRLVSAGSGQNLSLQIVLGARVVDGEVVWEIDRTSTECRG